MASKILEYSASIKAKKDELNALDFSKRGDLYRKDFLFFIAVVKLYFGNSTYSESEIKTMFKEFLLQREISILDKQTDIKILFDTIKVVNKKAVDDLLTGQPKIYCSFHYGSFITAIPFLISGGVELFVVSKNEYLVNEMATYSQMDEHATSKINSIATADWNSLIDISTKLKEGKSVFIYIDRLDGINISSKEKLSCVQFLNHELLVRRGIPEISFLRKVPIVSVFCVRNSISEIEISFNEHDFLSKNLAKQEYISRVMVDIFLSFESHVKQRPEQWDYWLDLFYQIDTSKIIAEKLNMVEKIKQFFGKPTSSKMQEELIQLTEDSEVSFNNRKYGIYSENEMFYLFNIEQFTCFKISANLLSILDLISNQPMSFAKLKNIVNPTLLEDLLTKNVLCIAPGKLKQVK
jgi:lauroyl/myristoyl acyltransferase